MTVRCTTCGHGSPIFLFRLNTIVLIVWTVAAWMTANQIVATANVIPEKYTENPAVHADSGGTLPAEPCGGLLVAPQGTVITPNFPDVPHPAGPITCIWRIIGGPESRISLLLTEVYVRTPDSISVAVYDEFSWALSASLNLLPEADIEAETPNAHVEKDWVDINLDNFPKSSVIETTKPVMVIKLTLKDTSRFTGFVDLHGLNLTYLVTPISEKPSLSAQVPESVCSYRSCSHLGRCLVSSAFTSTFCSCSEGSSGAKCQYGPLCSEPDRSGFQLHSPCGNRGSCRYRAPDHVICNCKENFTGDHCDTWKVNVLPDCEKLHCQEMCNVDPQTMIASCGCLSDGILGPDGRTCTSRTNPVPRAIAATSTRSPHSCRTILTQERGVVSSPNYPHAFPIPIQCEWIIEAGANRQTVLYFNEIYLKDPVSLRVSAYDYYDINGETRNEDAHVFTFEDYPDNLTITKPYVVLRMTIRREDFARNYPFPRVRQFLLDIFGFNVTYITYPSNSLVVHRNSCHPFECSFAGLCKTASDFESFYCECFEGFFGPHCEYGPRCGLSENPCLNNGSCKYYFGTDRVECVCPPGYTGALCEKKTDVDEKCKKLNCSHHCSHRGMNSYCECRYGFQLERDGRTCKDVGGRQLLLNFTFKETTAVSAVSVPNAINVLRNLVPGLDNCRRQSVFNDTTLLFRCQSPNSLVENNLRQQLKYFTRTSAGFLGAYHLSNFTITRFVSVRVINLSVYSHLPTLEKSELAIVCLAEGSPWMTVTWRKDDIVFDPSRLRDMWLTRIPLAAKGQTSVQLNIENVRRVHQGVYSCEVEDFGVTVKQSIYVEVLRAPEMEIYPASPFVLKGNNAAVTCMTVQKADFKWFRKGEDVSIMGDHSYKAYNIQPDTPSRGQHLVVSGISESSDFTCVASNGAGSKEQTVRIRVLDANDTVCQPERYGKIKWTTTGAGADNEQNCPDSMQGTARRHCTRSGHWMPPVFDDCASIPLLKLKTSVDSIQAGFGDRDAGNLKNLMARLNDFVNNRETIRGRDMGNAVEMLDVLHKLSGILVETGYKDDTVDEFWLKSVKRLLDHADTRSTVLDIFNRFPFITLRKTLLNTHNQLFIETGVARCWLHTEPIPKDGNHTWMLSENSMDCKLIPGGFVLLPHCVKVEVVVNVQRNVLPNSRKETVIQMHADFSRNESADSDHGMTLPGIVYLWLPDASSFLDSIIANITFTDFGEMLPLQWKHVLKTPTRGSAAHNISCLQRSDLGSVWSSDLCNTSVFLRENMDLISHVQCLCSLSKTSHFFTLKLTNYSSEQSDLLTVPSGTDSGIIVAVIGSIAVVVAVIAVVVWCFQKNKILSCMTAVKKRTSDFVRVHFGLPEVPSSEHQLEMSVLAENRTSSQAPAHPDETAALMNDFERRPVEGHEV